MSGGEFCSDAHRTKYQQEYSQLALKRLQQAKPPQSREAERPSLKAAETKDEPVKTPAAPAAAAPMQNKTVKDHPVATPVRAPVTAPAANAPRQIARVRMPSRPANPAANTPPPPNQTAASGGVAQPTQIAVPQPTRATEAPRPDAAVAPTRMAGVLTRKPAAATLAAAGTAVAKIEWLAPDTGPRRPLHLPAAKSAALPEGQRIALEASLKICQPAALLPEIHLELRSGVPQEPALGPGLHILRRENWRHADQPVAMRTAGLGPAPPVLWHAPPREFGGSIMALGASVEMGKPAQPTLDPQSAPQGQQKCGVREPVLEPMVMMLGTAIEAGRAKPVQVFSAWLPGGHATQIPRSEALPLRPVMVVGAPPEEKARKADVVIRAKPQAPAGVLFPAPSPPEDLSLPEPHVEASQDPIPSGVWRFATVFAGVLKKKEK